MFLMNDVEGWAGFVWEAFSYFFLFKNLFIYFLSEMSNEIWWDALDGTWEDQNIGHLFSSCCLLMNIHITYNKYHCNNTPSSSIYTSISSTYFIVEVFSSCSTKPDRCPLSQLFCIHMTRCSKLPWFSR